MELRLYSGRKRRCARFGVGAGAGVRKLGSAVPRDDTADGATGSGPRGRLGCADAAAPVLKAQQIRQLASWGCCWLPSSPGAGEWLRQISAVASGSEATAAKAKLAPIGARICTISAITKIGTYRVSRRILKNPFGSIKRQRYHKSRSPASAAARWSTVFFVGVVCFFWKQPDICVLFLLVFVCRFF